MAALDELIDKIEDPDLKERIRETVARLLRHKQFGLVFEEHLPECTLLPDIPIRPGVKASLRDGRADETFSVLKVADGKAICMPKKGKKAVEYPAEKLVTTAELGDEIYPCLTRLDEVCNAPENPLWHALIEGDNYHALQVLEYLYAGQVDCIYIDPPYNTGARDWKYNNDYVDDADAYRHSKWLSMMQKRLAIAKRLLNPSGSVLIVTIDDKEYLHLGCLLEDVFPEAKITMISSVINPAGKAKKGGVDFSRTDEYIFFLQIGNCPVLPETRELVQTPIAWESFRRHSLANGRGKHGVGACGPNQFYPIYVNDETREIVKIGKPLPEGADRSSAPRIPGCTAVFPVRDNGIEMNWGAVGETARSLYAKGYLRVGGYDPDKPQPYSIVYLTKGTIKAVESAKVVVTKSDERGILDGYFPAGKPKVPTTNWNKPAHNATTYGTDVIQKIFGDARFDYPKSLYAVRDCLALFLAAKKDALVVDFFAGSGTTLHAVNLLNAEDGGTRRCIIVTNNEVSPEDAIALGRRGLRPGDPEWEALGIARHVAWPRTRCTILGRDEKGAPLAGEYGAEVENFEAIEDAALFSETTKKMTRATVYKKSKLQLYPGIAERKLSDGFQTNAIFFRLGFLDKTKVSLGMQFRELLSLLWMKAGAIGRCPTADGESDMLLLPENGMAILLDENRFAEFSAALSNRTEIGTVFLATDYEPSFAFMAKALEGKRVYQLYRDYLDHFRLNAGRKGR